MQLNHLIDLARLLRTLKLSPLRAACLVLVQKNEQRGIPLRHLATMLGVSLAGAKMTMRRLEEEGYLRLLPQRGIQRVKLYEVTEAGVGALIQFENL